MEEVTLSFGRTELRTALDFLGNTVNVKGVVREFEFLQVTQLKNGVMFRTYDGFVGSEFTLKVPISGTFKEPFFFPFESLRKICDSPAKKGEVVLTLTDKKILVKYSSAKYDFAKVDPKTVGVAFNSFTKHTDDKTIKLKNSESFLKALKFCSIMQSDNASRSDLCGVAGTPFEDKQCLASTNLLSIAIAPASAADSKLFIPMQATKVLLSSSYPISVLHVGKGASPFKYVFEFEGDNRARIYVTSTVQTTGAISKYLTNSSPELVVKIKVAALYNTLLRAEAIYASTHASQVAHMLLFTIQGEKMQVSAVSKSNTFMDSVKVESVKKGKKDKYEFCGLLDEIIKAVDGLQRVSDKDVAIGLTGDGKIMALRDSSGFCYYLYGQVS